MSEAGDVYALGVPLAVDDIEFVSDEAKAEFMQWIACDSGECACEVAPHE